MQFINEKTYLVKKKNNSDLQTCLVKHWYCRGLFNIIQLNYNEIRETQESKKYKNQQFTIKYLAVNKNEEQKKQQQHDRHNNNNELKERT